MARILSSLLIIVLIILPLYTSLDQASFYGNSFISIPLKEAKGSTDIQFRFRTHLANALILLVAGTTDYCIVRLDDAKLKININLGSGEYEVSSPHSVKLNDFKWHNVLIVRKEANLTLVIDNIHIIKKHLPGKFFELNIHYGLFVGGHGNYSDIFFGHIENFRGCLAELTYNGIIVLEHARHRQTQSIVQGVTWNCAAEFDANVDRPISFVEDGSFMIIPHPASRNVKWQMEIKTLLEHALVVYNQGSLPKQDYLTMEIWKGKFRASVKSGEKIVEVISNDFVSDGKWHRINFKLSATSLDLNVDSILKSTKIPRNHVLHLHELFYVGGIELSKRVRAMAKGLKTSDANFKGCIQNVKIGEKSFGLKDALVTEGLLPNCVWEFPCLSRPCSDDRTCIQKGLDSYQCLCKDSSCTTNSTDISKVISKGSLATDLELLALKNLEVLEGQSVLITSTNLHMILDYPKYGISDSGIVFHILETPEHGSITIDVWPHERNSFSLSDVSRDKVHYIHDGSEHHTDRIVMDVEFLAKETFILPAYLQGRFRFALTVNVQPVNDPPELNIPLTVVLRLAQGGRKVISRELLRASDPDTPSKQLIFNILESPSGHFEHLYKSGMHLSSFTQKEVNDGKIIFVHNSSASNDSYISMQVSDGIETSKVAKLRVSAYPQLWRLQNNTGLVLLHQTSAIITPFNLSFTSNDPDAVDESEYQIIQPPQYGVIEVEKEPGVWLNTNSFTSEYLRLHRVRYHHISEMPDFDEFQFKTTLNLSAVYTFRMTFAKCKLLQVNYEYMILNETFEAALSKQQMDYQTEPLISPSSSVVFVITTYPKYGFLFSTSSKYRMRNGDTFTQEDVYFRNIKYRLFRRSFSQFNDTFCYVVMAPGCKNITGNVTIIYLPQEEILSKVHTTLEPVKVEEGGRVNIGPSNFDIKSHLFTDLMFNITVKPKHGLLQVEQNGVIRNDTSYFTLDELKGDNLFYVHDDSETSVDTFNFVALSKEEEDFEYVGTYFINIISKNDNSPIRVIDKIFNVVIGGEKLLTGDDLRYSDIDADTKPSDIVYTCRELSNGDILSIKNGSTKIFEFSQDDLDKRFILFKHKGPEYGKIKLWVTDGQFYVNGILEVKASAPFIRVSSTKKLVVQHGKFAIITNEHLSFTTNLFATDKDVFYEVVTKPTYGKIALKGVEEIKRFSQAQVNGGEIYYVHDLTKTNADELSLRVRCQDAINVAHLSIWILPATYWEPLVVKNSRTLLVEESTSALISRDILEVFQPDVPAGAITYHVKEIPQNGYLSILPNTQSLEDQATDVRSFTQALINERKLLYIQAAANETKDRVVFNVTNGMVSLHGLVLDIKIIPEHLYLGSNVLNVNEGGTSVITTAHLFVMTEYYKPRVTEYIILKHPSYGCIQVHKKCNKTAEFSQKELLAGVVHYAHDDSENLEDEITVVAVAGAKQSVPVTIKINILPINDQVPKLVNNTGVTIWEGSTVVITNEMLAAVDDDRPLETLRYQVVGCWWGNVSLTSDPNTLLQFFTQELIDKGLVAFRHQNGSETKFIFTVSDGLHVTKEYSFHIKTKPLILKLASELALHIIPLQKKVLTPKNLLAFVSDHNRTIYYEIVRPPALGRLMMYSNDTDTFKVVNIFTQDDINSSRIFYEHTHPFLDFYVNDSFIFNVKSYLAPTLIKQEFRIDISVSSGGLDEYVSIPKITVDEGGMTNIHLNMSGVVTFLENHAGIRSPVIHASATNPQYGQIFLQHTPNLTTFTQQQLESGQVYYQHDHSDSLYDNVYFSLYLIPGYIMLCNISVPIKINPINDQPFRLMTPAPHLTVVQGENHTITKNELLTEDADTFPQDLRYDVISGPYEGQLVFLPDLAPVSHFTQEDVNQNKLVYIHSGSFLTDTFHLRVWDGKFRPEYTIFNVQVLPISLNISTGLPLYLQQGSNVVLLSEKQFFIDTNTDRSKIQYSVRELPRHGVLYVKDSPANSFSQTELRNENVMYMQTDMTIANDSFRVFSGISVGNITIGEEVEVFIKVQPLMQLGNFTVVVGKRNRLTTRVLDATPLAKLTNSNPRYTVVRFPVYGQIRKIIRSSGEKRNVLDTPVNSFTHEEVQSGLIYLVVKNIDVGWEGLKDRMDFILAASIFQPALGELKILVKSSIYSIHSTLPGPNDPEGHEGGMHMASPNITRDYFLIVSMVVGIVILGIAVIIIIKCRALEPEEQNKEEQYLQPVPLPRPPDRLMSASPPLKQQALEGFVSLVPTTLPHCKVTPLTRDELEGHTRYPYGIEEQPDDWSSCDASDPSGPVRNNIMLRRNQYWV